MTTPAIALNLGQIKNRVKRTFGDMAEVQVFDSDITDWVNAAIRDLIKLNDLNKTKAGTDSVANQSDYQLPVGVTGLQSVKYRGGALEYLSLDAADANIPGRDDPSQYPTGSPQFYWVYNDVLTLYPAPDASVVGAIMLYYTSYPEPVAVDTDVPGVPVEYHNRIIDYCLAQAYELNGDIQSSQLKMTEFTQSRRELQGQAAEADAGPYPFTTDFTDSVYLDD